MRGVKHVRFDERADEGNHTPKEVAAPRSDDKKVRTVLGDIDPQELGSTDVHEHLLMRSPLLRGEELDDREKSTQEAVELRQTGIDALVDLTTIHGV